MQERKSAGLKDNFKEVSQNVWSLYILSDRFVCAMDRGRDMEWTLEIDILDLEVDTPLSNKNPYSDRHNSACDDCA
jgi:hypothetical protein